MSCLFDNRTFDPITTFGTGNTLFFKNSILDNLAAHRTMATFVVVCAPFFKLLTDSFENLRGAVLRNNLHVPTIENKSDNQSAYAKCVK